MSPRSVERRDESAFTWREYAGRVREIAAGLAGLGLRRGDTVALMMTNRPEFHLVDTAAGHERVPVEMVVTKPRARR